MENIEHIEISVHVNQLFLNLVIFADQNNSILLRNLALLCRDRLLVCVYELILKVLIHWYND